MGTIVVGEVPVKPFREQVLTRLSELAAERPQITREKTTRQMTAMRNDLHRGWRDAAPEVVRRCCRLLRESIEHEIAAADSQAAGGQRSACSIGRARICPSMFACSPRECIVGWPSNSTKCNWPADGN